MKRSTRLATVAAALLALGGCKPNPRREMPAVVDAGLRYLAAKAPSICIERTIAPWSPSRSLRRHEADAPAGFEILFRPGAFRGGGGIKVAPAGIRINSRSYCHVLAGPVIVRDHAMLRLTMSDGARKLWLRKTDAGWRVIGMTWAN